MKQTHKETTYLNRIEFHRNGMALLPDATDKDPGVAILIKDMGIQGFQQFCSCKASAKKTCPHILELNKVYKTYSDDFGQTIFENDFKTSIWHHIASAMADSNKIKPEKIRMQNETQNGDEIVAAYNSLSKQPLLFYLSQGFDKRRFKERCGQFPDGNSSIHRGSVLNKLGMMTLTKNERYMAGQGFKTRKHALEESFWFKMGYHGFREFGANGCFFEPTIETLTGEMDLVCKDQNKNAVFRLPVPREKVGELFSCLTKQSKSAHITIHPIPLKSIYKVSLNAGLDLEFRPLVQLTKEDGEITYYERNDLKPFQYGNYYFLEEISSFAIMARPERVDRKHEDPALMIIKKDRVPGFLDAFKNELKSDTYIVDDNVDKLKIYKMFDWGKILLEAMDREWCWLSMEYGFGDTTLSLTEIIEARKTDKQYIKVSEGWIDCHSNGFDAIDPISDLPGKDTSKKSQQMKLTRMELLRLRAANDLLPEVAGDKNAVDAVNKLFELKAITPLPKIKGMTSRLRNYQVIGTEWIWFLYENNFGGLLCDDMGLGKTHQVMAFMLHLKINKKIKKPFLVVCPTTVLDHWDDKIRTHVPGLKAEIYHGGNRDLAATLKKNDVLITSYGILRGDIKALKSIPFSMAVFDEIQQIKNSETLAYAAAKQIKADMKLGLTGTPIENTLFELKALMDLTVPGYFGADRKFKFRYVKSDKGSGSKRRQELSRLIYPFTLRRLKKTVLKELPEKIEDIRFCRLSDDQIKLYQDAVSKQGEGLLSKLKKENDPIPYIHVFALLTLLKQICDHPVLLEEKKDKYNKYQSGKWDIFKDILTQCLESDQKVVIYSQFLGMVQMIEKYLNDQKVDFVSLTGKSRKRGEIVSRFNNDPSCRVFVGSLKAGGTGIDLVAASVVIHYDRWWNAAKEDQATDRVHRIGQKRGVQVFKLVTKGTLEEKISAIIEKKRKLLESIVKEDDPGLLKTFSREDLIDMLSVPL